MCVHACWRRRRTSRDCPGTAGWPGYFEDLAAARMVLPEGTIEDGDGLAVIAVRPGPFCNHQGYMVVQPK